MRVNGLEFTLSVNVKSCNFISWCVKQCKCKNKYTYMVLHGYVKNVIFIWGGRIS